MLTIELRMLSYFEHVVQSLQYACLFGMYLLSHTKPLTTQI